MRTAFSLLKLIIKTLIAIFVLQVAVWVVIFTGAMHDMDTMMNRLVDKVTTINCLDVDSGEYGLFEEQLFNVNSQSLFQKYTMGGLQSATPITTMGANESDYIRYRIADNTTGDDSFSVKAVSDGRPLYSYARATQKYEPIEVKLQLVIYLPFPFYIGGLNEEHPFQMTGEQAGAGRIQSYEDGHTSITMSWGALPGTAGRPRENQTPALKLYMTRTELVHGLKYFKGQALG